MAAPKLSLVTFSYNDADLVTGLLAEVASWTVRPDEIVVVDDGSEPALDPARTPADTRILRLSPNQGITRAKHAGLSAASGETLLSMDADVRPDPDYAEICLGHLARPEVGLSAGEVVHDAGEGLVARYLRAFGDNHNLGVTGPVAFIPGNAFALRRAVWEEIGGYSGHSDAVCEDHYLCGRLRERGYILHSDAAVRARQTRRLGRITLCRRVWRWCREALAAQIPGDSRAVPYLFEVLVRPMLARLERIAALNEPLFAYLELLYLAHAGLDLLARAEARGVLPAGASGGLRAALEARLQPHPRLRALLRADLLRLGHHAPGGGRSADVEEFFLFWPALTRSGLLAWLDTEGVPRLLAEDAGEAFHFSAYDQMS